MTILLKDLAPEEQEYILQVGKISRPFAHDPRSVGVIQKLTDVLHSLRTVSGVYQVNGVDISVWQGDIDFSALKELAQFVLIRYGIGNASIDSKAAQNVAGAQSVNMPYGGYWYLKPAHAWDKHAEAFANAVLTFGSQIYATSDFEENGGKNKSDLDNWLQKYDNKLFTLLSNAGFISKSKELMWYSSKNIVDNYLPKPNGWMRHHSLDIAHWTTASSPLLPYEFTVAGILEAMWQHAVVNSTGYGVESAKIDLQRFRGNANDFLLLFGVPPLIILPSPLPGEEYMKLKCDTGVLNVRKDHTTTSTVVEKLVYGTVVEQLDEYVVSSDTVWVRIGYKQWCAKKYNGNIYLVPL